MAELSHTEVRLSGADQKVTGTRRPFVAPTIEHLGELETRTLLTDIVIPP